MITMYDSSHANTIPHNAKFVAGYIDGTDSFASVSKKAPNAVHMSIAVDANDDADCLDVEPGLAKVDQVYEWWKRQRARGVARPIIYATTTDMTYADAPNGNHIQGVLDVMKKYSIARSTIRLWAADYPYSAKELPLKPVSKLESLDKTWPHICGPATCKRVAIPVDGTQWTCWAYCPDQREYGSLDQSLLVDSCFNEAKPPTMYPCQGHKSLNELSQQLNNAASTMLRLTAEHSPGGKFYSGIAGYLNGVFAADRVNVPEYEDVYYPKSPSDPTPEVFHSHGHQTLQGLANSFGCKPADMVQYTAENTPGRGFSKGMADYLNGVFARSTTHVPHGTHLFSQK